MVTMLEVAIIGCGAIGSILAEGIDAGEAGATKLSLVYDLDPKRARAPVRKLKSKPRIVESVTEICAEKHIDLVIEAASQIAVEQYALKILKSKKDLMVMSVGAFSDEKLFRQVQETAQKTGQRVYIPSGAILGIDGVKAAIKAGIDEVLLTTRKPPAALSRVKYVRKKKIDLSELRVPRVVFEGTAKEAVEVFPKSVNVAATLSLAGIGLEKTKVRIVADPSVDRNVHIIRIRGKAGEFVTEAHNVPSPDNPKTSYLAALSALRTLRSLTETIVIGT